MGHKHGIWFDLFDHIAIHKEVIDQNLWQIKSGQTQYVLNRFNKNGFAFLKHSIEFKTINGCEIKITKETKISKDDPTLAVTKEFSFNCISKNGENQLRYHSPHSEDYVKENPWHNKHHRHEFDGKLQKIRIYSFDHRPEKDRTKKYTWKGFPVELHFSDNEDWPFISEFLDEVSHL